MRPGHRRRRHRACGCCASSARATNSAPCRSGCRPPRRCRSGWPRGGPALLTAESGPALLLGARGRRLDVRQARTVVHQTIAAVERRARHGAARAAAQRGHASARRRRRPAGGPGTARPFQPGDHSALHPRGGVPAARGARSGPPAGRDGSQRRRACIEPDSVPSATRPRRVDVARRPRRRSPHRTPVQARARPAARCPATTRRSPCPPVTDWPTAPPPGPARSWCAARRGGPATTTRPSRQQPGEDHGRVRRGVHGLTRRAGQIDPAVAGGSSSARAHRTRARPPVPAAAATAAADRRPPPVRAQQRRSTARRRPIAPQLSAPRRDGRRQPPHGRELWTKHRTV